MCEGWKGFGLTYRLRYSRIGGPVHVCMYVTSMEVKKGHICWCLPGQRGVGCISSSNIDRQTIKFRPCSAAMHQDVWRNRDYLHVQHVQRSFLSHQLSISTYRISSIRHIHTDSWTWLWCCLSLHISFGFWLIPLGCCERWVYWLRSYFSFELGPELFSQIAWDWPCRPRMLIGQHNKEIESDLVVSFPF